VLGPVALVVDGKTVDTKPLKVAADPEVGLTAVERKKLHDMAMEMHELRRLATQASAAITQAPKAMADANATIVKASTLSGSLARYKMTLTVPEPVKLPATSAAAKE
jgi:hypothetical protein